MPTPPSFPHSGYYYSDFDGGVEYRFEISSRPDFERLINGRPGFAHNTGQLAQQTKILIINDWRIIKIKDKENSYRLDQIYHAIKALACRENLAFTIYLQSHKGFTPFRMDMTLTEFVEIAYTLQQHMLEALPEDTAIMQNFLNFYRKQDKNTNITQAQLFVVNQFEMDALIKQSCQVEYGVALEDLSEFYLACDKKQLSAIDEKNLHAIGEKATYLTTHTIISDFDGGIYKPLYL